MSGSIATLQEIASGIACITGGVRMPRKYVCTYYIDLLDKIFILPPRKNFEQLFRIYTRMQLNLGTQYKVDCW